MPNSLVCVDASFCVRLVTSLDDRTPRSILETWLDQRRQMVAPTVLYYEVTNALYQYKRVGQMDEEGVLKALNVVMALPVQLHGGQELHRNALRLASKHGLKATYDAHYLALAEQLGADFWTADGRLARAVQSSLPWIHLLE